MTMKHIFLMSALFLFGATLSAQTSAPEASKSKTEATQSADADQDDAVKSSCTDKKADAKSSCCKGKKGDAKSSCCKGKKGSAKSSCCKGKKDASCDKDKKNPTSRTGAIKKADPNDEKDGE
jgi:hypothetical protein